MAKKNQSKKTDSKEEIVDDILNDEEIDLTEDSPKEVEKDTVDEPEKQEVKEAKDEPVKTEAKELETKKTESKESDDKTVSTSEDVPIESDVAPPKPKRPLSPKQEAFKNLKDAFPTIEDKYILGVLIASKYHLEDAFNGLLYISDPESVNPEDFISSEQQVVLPEETRPSLPARRSQQPLSQIEQDELLAKRLNDEYNRRERRRERQRRDGQQRRSGEGDGRENIYDDDDDDLLTNFVEKDLPQLKEQFTKNIEETKTKFNSWVSGWRQQYQQTTQNLNNKSQPNRSNTRNNYEFDEDPEEVDLQKFHGISLNDSSKKSSDFEDLDSKPSLPNRNRAGSTDIYGTPKNTKKWESLKGVKPEPISKTASATSDTTTANATSTTTTTGVVDDDFLLSDDEDTTATGKK